MYVCNILNAQRLIPAVIFRTNLLSIVPIQVYVISQFTKKVSVTKIKF